MLACLGDTHWKELDLLEYWNKLRCLMQKCEITLQAGFPSSVCLCVFVCVGGWDGMGGGRGGKEREIAKCERYK